MITILVTGTPGQVALAVHRLRQAFSAVRVLSEARPAEDGSVALLAEVEL